MFAIQFSCNEFKFYSIFFYWVWIYRLERTQTRTPTTAKNKSPSKELRIVDSITLTFLSFCYNHRCRRVYGHSNWNNGFTMCILHSVKFCCCFFFRQAYRITLVYVLDILNTWNHQDRVNFNKFPTLFRPKEFYYLCVASGWFWLVFSSHMPYINDYVLLWILLKPLRIYSHWSLSHRIFLSLFSAHIESMFTWTASNSNNLCLHIIQIKCTPMIISFYFILSHA